MCDTFDHTVQLKRLLNFKDELVNARPAQSHPRWNTLKMKTWERIVFIVYNTTNRELPSVLGGLDTWYLEMTGNNIGALGIVLLDAEKCKLEPEDSQYLEKPYKSMMYCYEHLFNTDLYSWVNEDELVCSNTGKNKSMAKKSSPVIYNLRTLKRNPKNCPWK